MARSLFSGSLSFGSFGSSHGQPQQNLQFKTTSDDDSLQTLILHGNLDIWIYQAQNLPNMDTFHKTLGNMFQTKNSSANGSKVTSDPYVTVSVAGAVVARTFVVPNSENPTWNQHFNVPVAHHAKEVHFVVKDNDIVGSQIIGAVGIPTESLVAGEKVEGVFPVIGGDGRPCKTGAALRVSVQYIPMERVALYGPESDFLAVQGTYFPMRRGGKVTLYQDADVAGCGLPLVPVGGKSEARYEHSSCWRDLVEAIRQARKLVYIVGWSVYHNVRLLRDDNGAGSVTLGELLKDKSREGVRVLLLVWDDPTSNTVLGFRKDGVMNTSDEDTRRFFKHSSVQVLLCPRAAGKGHSWVKQREVGTIYTHHQKTVIVDSDAGKNKRQIISFIGGLDLCKGRYDTPHHPIFRGVEATHVDDFHNPNLTPNDGCPRQPWHDLHSRIEGPAAYDILKNFEERWLKAVKQQSGIKKLKSSSLDDSLLDITRLPDLLSSTELPSANKNNSESWNVQIFRSIDSGSVKGFPKDPREATSKNLVCGKNILIDMSIHTAYVKAIRSAQHFIYMENQYFLGSSFNWQSQRNLGANNLIPMEIALKIVNKIRARERFAAYIVIPMWPEGDPTSIPIQRILFWQNKTMEMMYEMIYNALRETGLDSEYEPQDYLNFFCLGNREAPDGKSQTSSSDKIPQALTKKNRRFMIYVHSKGMIVDDEYVIIGSANINQRSLDGTRDTEIAMGAYQPHYTWAKRHSSPFGQIYGYRMSLWAEHIGGLDESFKKPESLECVRKVRRIGDQNWRQYVADEVTEMNGHLMKYPVQVDKAGNVNSLAGFATFPDLGGNILGTYFPIQENLTI